MGGNIDLQGKVCWVERPLKPSKDTQKRPSGTPSHLEHPGHLDTQMIRNTERWGAMGSMGEEFGGSHDIISA